MSNIPVAEEVTAADGVSVGVIDGNRMPSLLEARKVSSQAADMVKELVIDSPDVYQYASDEYATLRAQWKRIDNERQRLKAPILEAGRNIDDLFRGPLADLASSGEAMKSAMLAYDQKEQARIKREQEEQARQQKIRDDELLAQQREVERKAREAREAAAEVERKAQAARDEAARKAREAEEAIEKEAAQKREKAIAEGNAEAERLANEQARQARIKAEKEAADRQAELDAEAERERLAAEKRDAELEQEANALQDTINLAAVTPMAPAVVSQAKASGSSVRRTWKHTSVDKRELILGIGQAIADGSERIDELLAYVNVDTSALDKYAKLVESRARVPGVVFGQVANIATSTRGTARKS